MRYDATICNIKLGSVVTVVGSDLKALKAKLKADIDNTNCKVDIWDNVISNYVMYGSRDGGLRT